MSKGFVARAAVTIDAPPARVWQALTDPAIIRKYLFGTEVASTWEVGGTRLSLTQDNNTSQESASHSESNWRTVLDTMKTILEEGHADHGR